MTDKPFVFLDANGMPYKKQHFNKQLKEEISAPSLTGVRSVWAQSVVSGLTPDKLASILKAASQGDTESYLILAEEMEEMDLHYASVLGTRKRAISGVEVIVTAASEDKKDKDIADQVKGLVETPEFEELLDELLDALGKGYSVAEIIWDRGDIWKPVKYEWRDPRFFLFDQETGREILLKSEEDSQGIPLAPYKFVRHVPRLKCGLPIRGGLARMAALAFMCKSYTVKDWMGFLEVFGMPLRIGKYGKTASQDDIQTLVKAVANLGTDAAAIIPESMMIEFVESAKGGASGGAVVFQGTAEWWDKQISKGVENPFNALCEDIKAGKRPFCLIKITFDEALQDKLYERICLVTRKEWSPEAEAVWRREMLDNYGDGADEELNCIPRRSGGVWLSRGLIEGCAEKGIPVIRYQAAEGFVDQGEFTRKREIDDWCQQEVVPGLKLLDENLQTFVGEDFARLGDKTVIWILQIDQFTRRRTRLLVELGNVPYEQQKQIVFFILDNCPRLSGVWMDATGNGGYLAEVARQKYGVLIVNEVSLSVGWYETHTPPFKAAFEDKDLSVPKDEDIITDLRGFKIIDGVARMPRNYRQKGADGRMRHGDSGIAGLLAYAASKNDTGAVYAYQAVKIQDDEDQTYRTIKTTNGFRARKGLL